MRVSAMSDWIELTENEPEKLYSIGETFYRINPNGRYALYYNGKSWRESATVTNDMLTGEVE